MILIKSFLAGVLYDCFKLIYVYLNKGDKICECYTCLKLSFAITYIFVFFSFFFFTAFLDGTFLSCLCSDSCCCDTSLLILYFHTGTLIYQNLYYTHCREVRKIKNPVFLSVNTFCITGVE